MNLNSINILHIDLGRRSYTSKSYPELKKYIGGVGLASKLVLDHIHTLPVVFATGPLNGLFPFASKTCAGYIQNNRFVDCYGGGRLSTRINLSGYDAVIFDGVSIEPLSIVVSDKEVSFVSFETDPNTLGVPGRKSLVSTTNDGVLIDKYFYFGDKSLSERLKEKGVYNFVISATSDTALPRKEKYEKMYYEVLGMVDKMLIAPGDKPSCSGCPMGCEKSKEGEIGGSVLVHSLVGCGFAETIYSSVSLVFGCLNSLGYDYVHEDLEALSSLVYSNINEIYEKLSDSQLETK